MAKHQRRRGRLLLYSRGRGGRIRVTIDCAPRKPEEVGRLIRRWQLRLEAKGERFEGFRVDSKRASPQQ
jgi:hypothetical protein